MDPATITAIAAGAGNAVKTVMDAFGASAELRRYADAILARLPAAIHLGETVADVWQRDILPLIGMAQAVADPTPKEWAALDDKNNALWSRVLKLRAPE